MIQSWVEDKDGNKTKDFLATPPLFVVKPKGENTLRLMHVGTPLPTDRESVYWVNVKAIPAVEKRSLEDKNALQLAVLSRIKLLLDPLIFQRGPIAHPRRCVSSSQARRSRSPTLSLFYYAGQPPVWQPETSQHDGAAKRFDITDAVWGASGAVSFQTINDYGAMTPRVTGKGL